MEDIEEVQQYLINSVDNLNSAQTSNLEQGDIYFLDELREYCILGSSINENMAVDRTDIHISNDFYDDTSATNINTATTSKTTIDSHEVAAEEATISSEDELLLKTLQDIDYENHLVLFNLCRGKQIQILVTYFSEK